MKRYNFFYSSKTNTPTTNIGSTYLLPIGDSFVFAETGGNNFGPNVFVTFERTDFIQINNITFCYIRYSIINKNKPLGRFRIQILLSDSTWSTRSNIPKKDWYSNSSIQWTQVKLSFNKETHGIKLNYNQIDTAQAEICFSIILITHSE